MVRGPRRVGGNAAARRLENGHTGFAGQSLLEILQEELTEACIQYLVLKESANEWKNTSERRKLAEARGRVKGVAISVATIRFPLRRQEQVWWNYVKKLEQKHVKIAKEMMPNF